MSPKKHKTGAEETVMMVDLQPATVVGRGLGLPSLCVEEYDKNALKVIKIEIALLACSSEVTITPFVSHKGHFLSVQYDMDNGLYDERRIKDPSYKHLVSAQSSLTAHKVAKGKYHHQIGDKVWTQVYAISERVKKDLYTGVFEEGYCVHYIDHLHFDSKMSGQKEAFLYVHCIAAKQDIMTNDSKRAANVCGRH